jgi:hypothetical protein
MLNRVQEFSCASSKEDDVTALALVRRAEA